ncbi:tyrosine-type recombinase/integrase [Microbacterium aquimaris]|uniref:tyrosine-type recombinase/integrase n=1 Tax=Microbacterium aquimaris TaxID=459816 RepID=UPI002AD50C92|nr:tyrosine-type recombinase/integrase [Microbacterium aquimaris]MDZ8276370.1 tyrosine-type recombinase/integrase [Microbacterium aquimaris]
MTANHRLNDILRDAETYAHLREINPEMPDFVWHIMLGYRPHVNRSQWEAVRDFTLATAVALRPATFDATRRLMSMTGRFHAWVWSSTGMELTVDRVYTQNNIDLYLQNHLSGRSPQHRWGVARQLVANGRALTPANLRGLPAPDMKLREPFTPAQIATMHSWANRLSTVNKRQHAWGLLGLAGGAGLRVEEIVDINVAHIDVDGDLVFVNVQGARARRVPVRHAWARVLLKSIEGRPATESVFRGPHIAEYRPRIIQNFLTDHPAPVRPTPARLRAGWIVHHIDKKVPLPVLKEVGGFRTYDTLTRYLDLARPLDASDYTDLLVGKEIAR